MRKLEMKLSMKNRIDANLAADIEALFRVAWSKFVSMAKGVPFFKEAMYGYSSSIYLTAMLQKEIEKVLVEVVATSEFSVVEAKFKAFGIDGKYITNKCSTFQFSSSNFTSSLVKCFLESTTELSKDSIDQFIEKIKQFFDGNGIFVTKVQVVNFSMDDDLLELNDNFRIRKINSLEKASGEVRSGFKSHRYLFNYESSCFVAELVEQFEIEINDDGTVSSGTLKYDRNALSSYLDFFILSCRLLRKSDVFLDNEYISEFSTPSFSGGRSIYHTLNGYELKMNKLDVTGNEKDKIKSLFVTVSTDKRFNISINRLSLSMERKHLVDRLIDLIIGLEAFYKSSGSVHICLRPSFLLSNGDRAKAKEMYAFIDSQRDLRNKIVHGSGEGVENLNKDELDKLEEILRSSLQHSLIDKKQIPSGKEWNNIYF